MRSAGIRWWGAVTLVAVLGLAAWLLAGHVLAPATGAGTTSAACAEISATLSDGPDPGVDPVGYAQAQVRPLDDLRIVATPLARDVKALDQAFRLVVIERGAPTSRRAETAAVRALDAMCPRAAPS